MEIKKFRVKNYRSIKDTGDCYLSPKLTILAGKNEAGKTSILEALRDFHPDNEIDEKAVPIERDAKPEISVTYEIPPEKRSRWGKAEESIDITLTKKYGGKYEIKEDEEDVFPGLEEERENLRKKVYETLQDSNLSLLENKLSLEFSNVTPDNAIKVARTTLEQMDEYNTANLSSNQRNTFNSIKNNLEAPLSSYNLIEDINDIISTTAWTYYPNFVLFDTVADNIPNRVEFYDLENNEFIENLSKISDLNPELIQSEQKKREKQTHKRKVNLDLNDDYEDFWTQDATNLRVDWDSEELQFWIEENGHHYEPSIRSKGRQWHLSFYIKLTAHANEENPPIVLIDDPGIHLHKTAQEDILRNLERLSERTQVTFGTHSPYLIDPEKLNRVRLVEKSNPEGTKIKKIHSDADLETLSPILTAIGAAPSQGLRAGKENTVVVEGISDYYYLQAFREYLGKDIELNIVPGVGDTTLIHIGSILYGWGLDPIFVLDGDSENQIDEDLKEEDELGIDDDKIVHVHSEGAIEDVFSQSDFTEYVLDDSEKSFKSENSEYMNRAQKSKSLVSKMFYEKVMGDQKVELNERTEKRIKKIFSKLEKAKQASSY
ncbi:MAG: ATP-dependent endonuclease [Candidatus Nanohalobium sp.]